MSLTHSQSARDTWPLTSLSLKHDYTLSVTHRETQRPATQHACLPGCWTMGINKVKTCEENNICTGLTRAAKAAQKSIVPARVQRTTQNPIFLLFESPFTQVSTVRSGHPSLVSLVTHHQLVNETRQTYVTQVFSVLDKFSTCPCCLINLCFLHN
jgi:hypothetical protein